VGPAPIIRDERVDASRVVVKHAAARRPPTIAIRASASCQGERLMKARAYGPEADSSGLG